MPLLFSYGTLQLDHVQDATFGRRLRGDADALVGFDPATVPIDSAADVAASGQTHHANAVRTSRPGAQVPGTAFEVTDVELAAADRYEEDARYIRIDTTLASGRRAWVYVHGPSERAQPMPFDLMRAIDVLHRTPAALDALLRGIHPAWSRATEGPGTFSPFDNVGHLIDGEETDWLPRARIILAGGPDPVFEPYDRFRHYARNPARTLDSLLDEFAALRAVSLDTLQGWQLTDAQLDLPGRHPGLGPVTLRQLLAAWVVHDLGHVAQVARVMAKRYRDAIGPWAPDLPVVTDRPAPSS
jgi:hypothetical protein